jgi:hypothetical protein
MEPFHLDFRSILIQIDSFEAQYIELIPEMVESTMNCTPQLTVLI